MENDMNVMILTDLKTKFFTDSDVFKRLMKFYLSDINDLEKKGITNEVDEIYKKLNWDNENYYDCIYSFWTIFSYGFIHLEKPKYYITESGNIKNVYKTKRFTNGSMPEKYLKNNDEITNDILLLRQKFPELDFIASRYHSISNFAPCPDSIFNSVKMLAETGDFLCLIIDKIQQCLDSSIPLTYYYNGMPQSINISILEKWKDFFVNNREKYFFTEEYDVIDDKLVGKKLFSNQSLSKPLPITEEEYKTCISNIKTRLDMRTENISNRL